MDTSVNVSTCCSGLVAVFQKSAMILGECLMDVKDAMRKNAARVTAMATIPITTTSPNYPFCTKKIANKAKSY